MLKFGSIIVVAAVMFTGIAAACETKVFASSGTVNMMLDSGTTCSMLVGGGLLPLGTGSGVTVRNSVTNKGVQITQRPAHGRAGVAGLSGIAYASNAGYHGADKMVAVVDVEINGQPVSRTLQISIDVR